MLKDLTGLLDTDQHHRTVLTEQPAVLGALAEFVRMPTFSLITCPASSPGSPSRLCSGCWSRVNASMPADELNCLRSLCRGSGNGGVPVPSQNIAFTMGASGITNLPTLFHLTQAAGSRKRGTPGYFSSVLVWLSSS